jgi:hypothetical protein
MWNGHGQQPTAAARFRCSLIVRPDGDTLVRVSGSEPKSALVGPFKSEIAARAWVGAPSELHRCHDYWRSSKGGKQVPLSRDFDGPEIQDLLDKVAVTEICCDPFSVFYRSVGAAFMQVFERYRPGVFLSPELENEAEYAYWMKVYKEAFTTKMHVLVAMLPERRRPGTSDTIG